MRATQKQMSILQLTRSKYVVAVVVVACRCHLEGVYVSCCIFNSKLQYSWKFIVQFIIIALFAGFLCIKCVYTQASCCNCYHLIWLDTWN